MDWPGISFTWDLWYSCNYRCSYCWWEMDGLWDSLAKQHRVLSPEEWARVWERIHERYGEARLDILGGEPLLYPRFPELLEALSARHRLVITTNLSPSLGSLRRMLSVADPGRVHFNASFHPQFTDLDVFLEKALYLRDKGYEPGVLFVPWPPFLKRLSEIREAFRSRRIPFTVMIFQGRHGGKVYPEAYTPAERVLLGRMTSGADENKYRLLRGATKGKLCHSGRVYANVKGNGDVYRCGADAFGRRPMGNVFDPAFRLDEAPKPCPYAKCSCQEFRCLDEVMAR